MLIWILEPAFRQQFVQRHFLESDGDLIVKSFLQWDRRSYDDDRPSLKNSDRIPEFPASTKYYTVIDLVLQNSNSVISSEHHFLEREWQFYTVE